MTTPCPKAILIKSCISFNECERQLASWNGSASNFNKTKGILIPYFVHRKPGFGSRSNFFKKRRGPDSDTINSAASTQKYFYSYSLSI
jgi:hypothetical protein